MTTEKKLLKKKLREKRIKKEKNLRKAVTKRALDKVGKQMMPEEQGSFMTTIYKIWRDFMVFIGEIKCTYGIHDWKLCSGRPGQPKYTCCRCWIRSKILWEGTGSKEYYEKKHRKKEKAKVIYETKINHFNFEEVDIFLRVKGRLPTEDGDNLTQDILDEYCDKFEKGELIKGAMDLKYMYDLIKSKKISIKK